MPNVWTSNKCTSNAVILKTERTEDILGMYKTVFVVAVVMLSLVCCFCSFVSFRWEDCSGFWLVF